uniref:BTB/POZ domain-containing protein n=1 Tax=Vespula pensylvanica TaxID=30213 RepID=A0A834KLW2_VESPE|nr:hypothetical protein H0235_013960 [Vespula pensylvanica]
MGSRAVAVGAVAGAAGVSGEAGLAGVPRLLEDLARLSEDKDTADIVFLLGRDETPVYAHRIILQARNTQTQGYRVRPIRKSYEIQMDIRLNEVARRATGMDLIVNRVIFIKATSKVSSIESGDFLGEFACYVE